MPTRGLKQGDPMSPYFFILCEEAMSSMLHQAAREWGITGIPITKGGTRVNHMFFADDSLLLCRANRRSGEKIQELGKNQELLACYETALGQKINKDKTSFFFSGNTKIEVRTQIITEAGLILLNSMRST